MRRTLPERVQEDEARGYDEAGRVETLSAAAPKVRDVIQMLEADGWFRVAMRGSHRQYKHTIKAGRVTVAGKLSDNIAPGTMNSILKQAGLRLPKEGG